MPGHPSLPDADTTPLRLTAKLSYGAGHFGLSLLSYVVVAHTLPFYDPPDSEVARGAIRLVASSGLVGMILLISRSVDVVADPLLGFLSDGLMTRWGRRKPFMVASLPPLVVSFVMLWHPPTAGPSLANAIFVGVVYAAVFVFMAGFGSAYLALLPEIACSRQERISLAAIQGGFHLAGIGMAALFVTVLAPRYGLVWVVHLVALICLVTMLVPCLGPRERARYMSAAAGPHMGLRRALVVTFTNRSFLVYWGGYYCLWLAFLLLMTGVEYFGADVLGQPVGAAGTALGWGLLCGLVCLWPMRWAATRFGNRRALLGSLGWFALMAPLLGLAAQAPRADGLLMTRLVGIALGPSVAGLFGLPYLILADICDLDHERTGEWREAFYFGFQATMLKGGLSFAPLLLAFVVHLTGADRDASLGSQLFGPLAGIIALVGFVAFRFFPRPADAPLALGEGDSGG